MAYGTTLNSSPVLTDDNQPWPEDQPPPSSSYANVGPQPQQSPYYLVNLAKSLWSGATLPGDVATGKASMTDPATQARVQDMTGLQMGSGLTQPAEEDALNAGLRAFHASPHSFDRFDISKIGSGEGAQVYGRGLYFAQNPDVMESYYRNFSQRQIDPNSPAGMAKGIISALPDREAAVKELQSRIDAYPQTMATHQVPGWLDKANSAMDLLQSNWDPYKNAHRYEVDINTHPDRLLDWDKPLSQQSPVVQQAVQSMPGLKSVYGAPGDPTAPWWQTATGEQAYRTLAKRGIGGGPAWNDRGVFGTKYADQLSRGAGPSGPATQNYAIWKPDLLNIVRHYSAAGAPATFGNVFNDKSGQTP